MPDESPKSKNLTVLIRIPDPMQSPLKSRFEQMVEFTPVPESSSPPNAPSKNIPGLKTRR
jgi:hypothetical protein